jgi:hypothetical protein
MFIAAVFTIAKIWKQPRGLTADERKREREREREHDCIGGSV